MSMRLVCSSDWHGETPKNIPDGDVLVLAGDCLAMNHDITAQSEHLRYVLAPFLRDLPHKQIVMIAGNHDFLFARYQLWRKWMPAKVHYLQDEGITIDGVKFWGSPWSRYLPGWVFMDHEPKLWEQWQKIDKDIDVLVVHGPPHMVRDLTCERYGRAHVGSSTLREWLVTNKPPLVVCGHIHEGTGTDRLGEKTMVHNVSYLDENYVHGPGREPVVVDFEK